MAVLLLVVKYRAYKRMICEKNIINDGVEAQARESQARLQIFFRVFIRGRDWKSLKPCLRFPCFGLNLIVYFMKSLSNREQGDARYNSCQQYSYHIATKTLLISIIQSSYPPPVNSDTLVCVGRYCHKLGIRQWRCK